MATTVYPSLPGFLASGKSHLAKGPVAMMFVEDDIEIDSTLRHHIDLGFKTVLAFVPEEFSLSEDVAHAVIRITHDVKRRGDFNAVVDQVIEAAPGLWMYYCFNAEYLFFPFCETRTVGEMLSYHTEERRNAMLTYVVDIYARDLGRHPNAVSLEDAHLDRSGYYVLGRTDPETGVHKERQLNFYGRLRWRYEEHVPEARRKIDRIAIFRAKPGLRLRADHTFNDEEYNTYSCEWHHNLTASIASFRTAKALKLNPGSTFDIHNFCWHNSTQFEWHSRQLLDLGLMEPGQWF